MTKFLRVPGHGVPSVTQLRQLFRQTEFRQAQNEWLSRMHSSVESVTADGFARMSVDELAADIAERLRVEPPRLLKEEIQQGEPEERYATSRDPFFERSVRSRLVAVEFFVPFTGSENALTIQPTHSLVTDWREFRLVDHEIVMTFEGVAPEPADLQRWYARMIGNLEKQLSYLERDLRGWNSHLESKLRQLLEGRRRALEHDEKLVGSLGLTMRRRGDAPRPVPLQRKHLATTRKNQGGTRGASDTPPSNDPRLTRAQYEEIVSILGETATGFERSPRTLVKLTEEEIRDQILIVLNSHFRGQATGETFNAAGKTDILVRVEDRNAFIGECKFYRGPKSVTSAVGQLLKYLAWRDAHAALVLIFRGIKGPTEAIRRSIEAIRDHASFVREVSDRDAESGRYEWIVAHPDDSERRIHVTLISIVVRDDETSSD